MSNNKHLKRCLTSLVIIEMKISQYHFILTKTTIIKNEITIKTIMKMTKIKITK